MPRDEIESVMRETEPEWLGSFRQSFDTEQDLPASQPEDFGESIISGRASSPDEPVLDLYFPIPFIEEG